MYFSINWLSHFNTMAHFSVFDCMNIYALVDESMPHRSTELSCMQCNRSFSSHSMGVCLYVCMCITNIGKKRSKFDSRKWTQTELYFWWDFGSLTLNNAYAQWILHVVFTSKGLEIDGSIDAWTVAFLNIFSTEMWILELWNVYSYSLLVV